MRKGEVKKQAILTTAEKMFCQKGYKDTSVQDILNALGTSKGSFYHHFVSKEEVLTTLCADHAAHAAEWTEAQLKSITDPLERIDTIFFGMIPLRRDEVSFISMLLPLMYTQEGKMVCISYQDALSHAFQPLLKDALEKADSIGAIRLPKGAAAEELVLNVVHQCWFTSAEILLHDISNSVPTDPQTLLQQLLLYRTALQRLLDAPYGSFSLIRLEPFLEAEQLIERKIILPDRNKES